MAETITGVATSITAFLGAAKKGSVNQPVPLGSFAEFEQRFGGLFPDGELGYAVRQFFRNGGTQAVVVRIAKKPSTAKILAGLRALASIDLFNLLVLPGLTAPAVLTMAAEFCRTRRAFFIADVPANLRTPAEVVAFSHSPDAAIYFPWPSSATRSMVASRARLLRAARSPASWRAPTRRVACGNLRPVPTPRSSA